MDEETITALSRITAVQATQRDFMMAICRRLHVSGVLSAELLLEHVYLQVAALPRTAPSPHQASLEAGHDELEKLAAGLEAILSERDTPAT